MLNAIKILAIAAALVTMAMPAYTHDASNYAHRELYVKVEVGLLRECVRQMWAGGADNVPLYQRSLIRTHAPICACRGT